MNINLSKYHFPPIYVPLLHDKSPTKILYGSRASGKSDFACQLKIIRCLTMPYFKCLMVRKHKENVKKSLYDTLVSVINRMGLTSLFEFKEHRTEIHCINGNKFIPLGLYEPGSKTGTAKSILNPTDALVDELDEATEDEYEKLDLSLRGSESLEIIGIFNTHIVDVENWIFKRWFPPVETFEKADGSHTYVKSIRKGTIILHTTFFMNPFISQKNLDKFAEQKLHAPERYEISGLGLIRRIKQTNLALKSFDRIQHINDSIHFNNDAMVYLSWDFNRLPHHTVGLWQFGGSDSTGEVYNWNLVSEFCLPDHSIREVQKEINNYLRKNNYQNKTISIICDYSGNKRTDHGTLSDINKIKSQIRADGFEVRDMSIVNPSVTASLSFVNDIFAGLVRISHMNPKYGNFTLNIQVNPQCKFHIADYEKTKLDREGKIFKITKKDTFVEDGQKVSRTYQERGHAVDGTRYMATAIFNFEYDLHKSAFNN